jgi:hypothetical protein
MQDIPDAAMFIRAKQRLVLDAPLSNGMTTKPTRASKPFGRYRFQVTLSM